MTFVVIALPFSTKPQKGYLMKIGIFTKLSFKNRN